MPRTDRRRFLALPLVLGLAGLPLRSRAAENHEHHHHHHDAMQQRVQRTLASYPVPNVVLTDSEGRPVPLRPLLDGDEPVMLNFIFTTCTAICPVMSSTFSKVQSRIDGLGKPVRLVSISIDPEHDTPARLRDYGRQFEAGPRWTMLTGRLEDCVAVQKAFDAYRGDKMNHDPATYLRMGRGAPWLRLEGFASADDLLREYRQLAAR